MAEQSHPVTYPGVLLDESTERRRPLVTIDLNSTQMLTGDNGRLTFQGLVESSEEYAELLALVQKLATRGKKF